LHVGQYISTFIVRNDSTRKSYNFGLYALGHGPFFGPNQIVGGRLCSAANLTSSPRTTRQERTPFCVVPLLSIVRSAATRRAARSTPSDAQDVGSPSATIARMSTAALPRWQVK
jgi:hypothetical protein